MRPVIEVLQRRGHRVEVTARDFAQTLELCRRFGDRAHRGRPPPRRDAGRQGAGPGVALAGAGPLGARAATSTSRSATAPTTSPSPPALLRIPCATTFDYEWATVQHTVNCRLAQAVVVPDVIPPERLYRYGARGKLHGYAGLKEEYYLARLRARTRRCSTSSGSTRDARSRWSARPRPSRSTTASRTTCSARCSTRLRGEQVVVLPRTPEQRAELRPAGGFIVPEHAIDAQSLIALRRPRRLGRRHDEPGGGGARDAGVHGVRGPARRGRRAADRRRAPAAADRPGAGGPRPARGAAAAAIARIRRDPAILDRPAPARADD